MTIQRVELMPGVWLTTVRTKKFKSSYWAVRLLSPLKLETAALNALLPFVLRRGTAQLPNQSALAAELDELYGGTVVPAVDKLGDVQCVGFDAAFLDDALIPGGASILERCAALLGDLLLHPATKNGRLRSDYVKSEQENLIRRIRSSCNDKRQYARERLIEEMYGDSDYAVSCFGSVDKAAKINVTKLFGQYQTMLECAPVELYYCGSASPKRVELAWREALMGLPRGMERYEIESDHWRTIRELPRQFRETLDVQQGKMELGFTLGLGIEDELYPAMLVVNAMFGGSSGSRLFLHVREKRSLCYYAQSSLDILKGLLVVSCGVEPEKFGEAQEEILAQLEALQQGQFDQCELDSKKRSVVNALRSALDEQGRLAARWLIDCVGAIPFDPEQLIRRVEEVTAGQAEAAAMQIMLDSIYCLSGPEAERGGDAQ